MRILVALGARAYRAVLLLYPTAFREEFSAEMRCDFHDASADAWGSAGTSGLFALWTRTAADALATIPAQWMQTGLPLIGVAALGPFMAAACAAWFWPWRRMALPTDHPHFDIIVLEISITTVLFIIVATILLTHWFTRRMFARRRA